MAWETWYMTEDGEPVPPSEVVVDPRGALRHKDGTAIKMRPDLGVPLTRGVDPDAEWAKRKAAKAAPPVTAENDERESDRKTPRFPRQR
jgi:hypothetical protein